VDKSEEIIAKTARVVNMLAANNLGGVHWFGAQCFPWALLGNMGAIIRCYRWVICALLASNLG
jgi:lipid-A-disaccharide synthase-like uncharacterized protein